MKMKSLFTIRVILLAIMFSSFTSFGQSTFTKVYQILQSNCLSSGCHDGSDATFNLAVSDSVLYNALVRKNPINTAAAAKGDKLVSPGDPHRSFLLRKINNGLDADNGITIDEGDAMVSPANQPLSNYEIELVSQWILFGAPKTGVVVDTAIIKTYYTVGGVGRVIAPPAPDPSEGFQVHIGRIFLAPGKETEIFIKYNPKVANDLEVTRVESVKSPQLHHFIIYTFHPGADASYPDGWRDTSRRSHGNADMFTALFPQIDVTDLPSGTAYYLPKNSVFDIDAHLKNYSLDSVMAAEAYFNVYTQPVGTAGTFMRSRFYIDESIVIPPGDTTIIEGIVQDTSLKQMWNIWILYSHTHKYGKDFDIWLRNPDGTKGEQIYEGFYNLYYTFNQGFYGTDVESPQRHFLPFLEVDPRVGLAYRVKWYNSGPDTVRWGLTLNDEMLAMGFQFVYGDSLLSLGIGKDMSANLSEFSIFPNPASGTFSVNFTLQQRTNVILELTNILGKTTELINERDMVAGNYLQEIVLDQSISQGVYLLSLRSGNSLATQRIIIY